LRPSVGHTAHGERCRHGGTAWDGFRRAVADAPPPRVDVFLAGVARRTQAAQERGGAEHGPGDLRRRPQLPHARVGRAAAERERDEVEARDPRISRRAVTHATATSGARLVRDRPATVPRTSRPARRWATSAGLGDGGVRSASRWALTSSFGVRVPPPAHRMSTSRSRERVLAGIAISFPANANATQRQKNRCR